MAIAWWHWLVLGLLLIGLEMAASGGFYIIFFGIAAVVISLMALAVETPLWLQLLLFSILSVAFLLFFRNPLMRWMRIDGKGADVDSLVGETAIAQQEIPPQEIGRVELRGTSWSARNGGATLLTTGRRCTVVRVDRLMLIVEAEGARS